MSEQSEALAAPGEAKIKDLADAAAQLRALETAIELAEKTVAELKEKHRRISEEEIPEKMFELGMEEFTLLDGSIVSVSPQYGCAITEANRFAAYEFLRKTGNESLIKNVLALQFGKGEDKKAQEVKALLETNKLPFSESTTIHPQTLKAFIKESIEEHNGEMVLVDEPDPEKAKVHLPMNLFSVFVGKKATIKTKKAKGQKADK